MRRKEPALSADSKRIKILALVTLIFGLAATVVSLVLLFVSGMAPAYGFAVASGVVSLYLGVQGALIANVPNTIKKLVTLSTVLLLVQVVLGVALYFVAGTDQVPPYCVICASVLLALLLMIFSRSLNKKNLAK
jgi:hypothetical protein